MPFAFWGRKESEITKEALENLRKRVDFLEKGINPLIHDFETLYEKTNRMLARINQRARKAAGEPDSEAEVPEIVDEDVNQLIREGTFTG